LFDHLLYIYIEAAVDSNPPLSKYSDSKAPHFAFDYFAQIIAKE